MKQVKIAKTRKTRRTKVRAEIVKYETKARMKFVFPDCPGCGDDDWSPRFEWKGNEQKTFVHCRECGFKGKALKYLDATHVWLLASPIQRR